MTGMYHHAPKDYVCPFCGLIKNFLSDENQLKPTDIVYQSEDATALMATRRWPKNQGLVIIIANQHFENIYDLPIPVATEIYKMARTIALSMKTAYGCDGILLRQHNEPAGDQHIWHYHLHVIPRYENDNFHTSQKEHFPPQERAVMAQKLRDSGYV